MSHDYGKDKSRKKPTKKNQRVSQKNNQVPGWVLFCSGVAFTLFAQFLFHVATVKPDKNAKGQKAVAIQQQPEPKKPTINFYNQLKDMDVPAPDNSNSPVRGEPVTGHQEKPSSSSDSLSSAKTDNGSKSTFNQVLQAGSYKTQADADEQRAALSLMGMKTRIEVKPNVDGTTYYRVMVGPFTSATELEKARQTLTSNNVPTITVRR